MKLKEEYKNLTSDIYANEYFDTLKSDIHHGTNKYAHLRRVSLVSFCLAKILKANVKETTRAGLLHDFFFGTRTESNENDYLNHPLTSAKNAKIFFNINDNEQRIIESHMYHYAYLKKNSPFKQDEVKNYCLIHKPIDKESKIVCLSDLLVSIYEVSVYKPRYSLTLYTLFLVNIFRY